MRRVAFFLCSLLAISVAGTARARNCPNIMFLVDQSSSMSNDVAGNYTMGVSKWDMVKTAIGKAVDDWGATVPFGLELISSFSSGFDQQCLGDAMITVEISHATGKSIKDALDIVRPDGETNTGEAITRALADTKFSRNAASADYIVLFTDGDANCNSQDLQNPGTLASMGAPGQAGVPFTLAALDQALLKGVKTYVIGFDGKIGLDAASVNPANLDAMAKHGGTAASADCGNGKPCYLPAGATPSDLEAVLTGIFAAVGVSGTPACLDDCHLVPCSGSQKCAVTADNPAPHCVDDPCGGMSCAASSFCRGGGCVPSCTAACPLTTKCQNGVCVADICAGKSCGAGQICRPSDGTCVASPCGNCTAGNICDVAGAKCVPDLCLVVTCPASLVCVNNGNCVVPGNPVIAGGGCKTGGTAAPDGKGLLLLAVLALFFARRRSSRAA